jgi:hypothetical protein
LKRGGNPAAATSLILASETDPDALDDWCAGVVARYNRRKARLDDHRKNMGR